MPAFEPQARFLLRGSTLLLGLLTLWWFVLLGPMLYLLQVAARGFVLIQENPNGDWTLRVPLEKTLPVTPQRPVAQQIHSVDFDMPRSDAIAFTFSLPVYWAIVLAAPGARQSFRPLLMGTALMSAFELVLLLIFTQITARTAAAQLTGADDAAGRWFRHAGEYLVVGVLPYAMPFVVALWLHGGLRRAIFPWGREAEIPAPRPLAPLAGRPEKRRNQRH
jgi:hypothetical protein